MKHSPENSRPLPKQQTWKQLEGLFKRKCCRSGICQSDWHWPRRLNKSSWRPLTFSYPQHGFCVAFGSLENHQNRPYHSQVVFGPFERDVISRIHPCPYGKHATFRRKHKSTKPDCTRILATRGTPKTTHTLFQMSYFSLSPPPKNMRPSSEIGSSLYAKREKTQPPPRRFP